METKIKHRRCITTPVLHKALSENKPPGLKEMFIMIERKLYELITKWRNKNHFCVFYYKSTVSKKPVLIL